jgi:hypothetical protein
MDSCCRERRSLIGSFKLACLGHTERSPLYIRSAITHSCVRCQNSFIRFKAHCLVMPDQNIVNPLSRHLFAWLGATS